MKKILKLVCGVCLLAAAVTAVTACGKWGDPYQALDKQGYTVSVRFDANGGVFANTNDVEVVDVFNPENLPVDAEGNKYTYLLPPDDSKRGNPDFTVSREGYFLAGWYEKCDLRVNEQGEALDDYGELVSVSKREQGHIYSGRVDFSKPWVIDPAETEVKLYAAWIPYFTFEFYADEGNTPFATATGIELSLPEWSQSTGKLDMKKFPARENMTFDGAFLDAEMTQAAPTLLTGVWDVETGVATTPTVKVYTTWLEGTWYRIYDAKQFKNNSRLNGNYILCADIDFAGEVWAPTLTTGKFTGQILGNGYKISNVSVEQADATQIFGGIFGTLESSVRISDVTFENVTYKVGVGSRMPSASFGILAGEISSEAVLENVSISGELIIGQNINKMCDYAWGLVSGSETDHGVDFSGAVAKAEEGFGGDVTVEEGSDRVYIAYNG